MKNKMFLLELLAVFSVMVLGAVPLLSQVPESLAISEDVSAESLAREFRQTLKEISYLEVSADYEASYLNIPVERDPTKAIEAIRSDTSQRDSLVVVNASALSKMWPDRFEATFWRKDQMDEYPDGLTKLRLEPPNFMGGMPTLHESHNYPLLGGVKRENSFTTDNLCGAGDSSLSNPLFAEIPGACSSAELWFTWLGQSSQAQSFENIISEGQLVGLEKFDGRDSYRIERTVYEDEEEQGFYSYHQVFWIDHESRLLIGWRQERTSLNYSKEANYLVVTISYHYSSDEDLIAVQSSLPPG